MKRVDNFRCDSSALGQVLGPVGGAQFLRALPRSEHGDVCFIDVDRRVKPGLPAAVAGAGAVNHPGQFLRAPPASCPACVGRRDARHAH